MAWTQLIPAVICLIAGMALVILEIFLPGFGLPGLSGIALILVGTVMIGVNFGAVVAVPVLIIVAAVLAVLAYRLLNSVQSGKLAGSPLMNKERDAVRAPKTPDMLGEHGVSATPLRPAGIAEFGEKRINVVTEGEFIDSGIPVEVVAQEGTRIVVRRTAES